MTRGSIIVIGYDGEVFVIFKLFYLAHLKKEEFERVREKGHFSLHLRVTTPVPF